MADEKSPLDAASERIRETAKWLTVSLAALGGVLVAGSQLSDIGALELWGDRFWTAVIGAAIAAVGSGIILVATINTAAAPMVSLKELVTDTPKGAEDVVTDETLLDGRSSVQQLKEEYVGALEDREEAYAVHLSDPSNQANRAVFTAANARAVALNGTVRSIVAVCAYRELARLWKVARVAIVAGGVLGALGVGVFAWAANPPDEVVASGAKPAVLTDPEPALITLTTEGRAALSSKLGKDCAVEAPVAVLKLGSTDAGPDAMVQQEKCATVRFILVPAWGSMSRP